MVKLLLRWLVLAVAVAITVMVVPGIYGDEGGQLSVSFPTLLGVSLILGLVNAVVRPLLKMLSCAFIAVTLGLFIFVINAAMLLLTSSIAQALGMGFYVDGFWTALIGSIIISLVSIVLNAVIPDDDEEAR